MAKESANLLDMKMEALMWIAGDCKYKWIFRATSRNATEHDDLPNAKPHLLTCSYAMCVIRRVAYRSHSRFSTPSALNLAIEAFVISFTVLHPVSCMHRRNSLCMVSSMRLTPASPSYYHATSATITEHA